MKRSNSGICILAGALALAGCGGGGGGSDTAAVTSSGTITGFGSIYVNGVRYRTDRATVEFDDDNLVNDDRLRRGMRVTVKGDRNGGQYTARRIEFDAELEGALDADPVIDDPSQPKVGSFRVGGFLVETSTDTVFDQDDDVTGTVVEDLTDLSQNDPVEVSAFATATGFQATRVELEDGPIGPGEFEVKGVVSDTGFVAGTSFEIQGVIIDISGAVVEGELAPGVLVEVEGDLVSGRIEALSVEVEDDLFDDAFDDEIELEGILERIRGELFVAGYRVLDPNGLLDAFNDGDRIEVELARNGGQLVVVEVELEVEETVRTEDEVASVDGDAFTTRLGLRITPTGGVELEDDLRDDDQITVAEFMLHLQPNDRIEAEGFPSGGSVTWTEIEREDDGTGCRLRGHAESGVAPLVIQGVRIDTATGTAQFKDATGGTLTEGAFFTALSEGDVVEAKTDGSITANDCTSGLLIAKEVSFEPADD